MALVRFDQEPDHPFGVGTFHGDDGSTFFGEDQEMAAQLSPELQAAAAPPDDERMASFESDLDSLGKGFDRAANFDRSAEASRLDAPNAGLVAEGANVGRGPAAPGRTVPAAVAPPVGEMAPAQPIGQGSPALDHSEQLYGNMDKFATRKRYDAPRAGGVVPTTQSEVRETQGMPYDPNGPEAQARAEASINVNMAGAAKAHAEGARAAGEAAAWQAAMPQLEEQARVAQMRRDMQERQYRRDREDLEMAVEKSNKSAKSFDANKWFNDGGAVTSIGAAFAQAFGAGAAALTGGPNVVLQQVNSYVDRSVMSQRAAIEADEKNANNALAQLNRQYGNLDQAEAALRIALQKKVEMIGAAYAASTKSEDIMNSFNVWLADNEQRRVADEQKFQNAAYGKTAVTTAAKVVQGTRGGMRDPTTAEMTKDYEMLGKRADVFEKTQEGEIKRQEAFGTGGKKAGKIQDEVAAYGKAIEGAKLNEYEASIANVEEKLRAYAGQPEIPGVAPENIAKRAVKGALNVVGGEGTGEGAFYSKDERSNRQTVDFLKADIRHALTGAGMSDKERTNLDDMIEKARTPDDLRSVTDIVKGRVRAHKEALARGFSPEAVRIYESRGEAKPMPLRTVR